jgi:uracil-DNA glycosylase
MRNVVQQRLIAHQEELAPCTLCPKMIHPPVLGPPVLSKILQVGQAPGPNEQQIDKPFAWTAGKTLFDWYASLGVPEDEARSGIYMAAVCRCHPGKNARGGDRVPDKTEIATCRRWLLPEAEILAPRLVIPVGKLAIAQFLSVTRLDDVVGQVCRVDYGGRALDVVPLPHPSGLSTWHKTEPGKSLLRQALAVLGEHPVWRQTFGDPATS